MTTYKLTPAQNMHNIWIHNYGTQQVSGVSIVAALKAPMEFSLLEECIREEYRRSGCLRLQFTKPDKKGNVKQYIVSKDKPMGEIKLVDLSGLTYDEADSTMQHWAYETFDGDNIPMCEFRLVKLPQGYNGLFVHMDHRLIDASGMVGIMGDLFGLYASKVFGTKQPDTPADFKEVLLKDLEKCSNERRLEKDRRFWAEQLDTLGEPLYSDIRGRGVLEASRQKHNAPELRAADIVLDDLFVAVKDYYLEPEPASRVMKFCERNQISPTNLLLLTIRTYLSKVNGGQEDITIQNFISRRSTIDEWHSGGSRTIMFPCRTVIGRDTEFLNAALEIQLLQNRIYMHSNYDPALIAEEMKRRYNTPDNTSYESCYLTYQPVSVSTNSGRLKGIPMLVKWFANGAATKKMYLTVSHTDRGEMKFSYHYQTACYDDKDMELLYYYMMKIMFKGINEPYLTVGEIMDSI